jgi:carbon starvation protein
MIPIAHCVHSRAAARQAQHGARCALLLLAVVAGLWVDASPTWHQWFDLSGEALAGFVILYGLVAAILPVWLLLAPRDYLSTFIKLGTVFLLAIAVCVLSPEVKMPALTRFIDGTGPIFSGKLFPFLFITLACGAVSGFHSLVASGTTPKLIARETDIPLVGYGSMALESFVGVMAMVPLQLIPRSPSIRRGHRADRKQPHDLIRFITAEQMRRCCRWRYGCSPAPAAPRCGRMAS